MNRQAALNNPVVWVLGGALAATWVFGVLHAWQAHSLRQALAAVLLPPYGIYMAVEQDLGHRGDADDEARSRMLAAEIAQCRTNTRGLTLSRLSREQYDIWCDCVSQMIVDAFTSDEARYVKAHGENSPAMRRKMVAARQSCYSSARYLGNPGNSVAPASGAGSGRAGQ